MELAFASLLSQQNQLSLFGNFSDRCERHSTKGLRQQVYSARSNSEEQFIVLAAMQRQLQRVDSKTANST